jgi:hypothetical protein
MVLGLKHGVSDDRHLGTHRPPIFLFIPSFHMRMEVFPDKVRLPQGTMEYHLPPYSQNHGTDVPFESKVEPQDLQMAKINIGVSSPNPTGFRFSGHNSFQVSCQCHLEWSKGNIME